MISESVALSAETPICNGELIADLPPSSAVLDFGCGRHSGLTSVKDHCAQDMLTDGRHPVVPNGTDHMSVGDSGIRGHAKPAMRRGLT